MNILIISHNEICYNPRLLKAADYFSDKGCSVSIYNPITGIASESIYKSSVLDKSWKLIENDISKRNLSSYLRWVYVSLINKAIALLWGKLGLKTGFRYFMNKGLLGGQYKIKGKFDFILIHLVDSLPFAANLKKQTGARLIYDSQEYFKGQYTKYAKPLRDWVHVAEPGFIKEVDILLATTNAMLLQLGKDYSLTIPMLRVRNLPSKRMLEHLASSYVNQEGNGKLNLIWHGMAIYFNNTRGVHILLKALSLCKSDVHLSLQGLINAEQLAIFEDYKNKLNLTGKVSLLPPAGPYEIVGSLEKYDIGLIGELAQEENQMLTSSNKLFDFMNAGLVVIASDMPGLNETIKEYGVGFSYPPGDYVKLAELIDSLAKNRDLLKKLKTRTKEISERDLFWEKDYDKLWSILMPEKSA